MQNQIYLYKDAKQEQEIKNFADKLNEIGYKTNYSPFQIQVFISAEKVSDVILLFYESFPEAKDSEIAYWNNSILFIDLRRI